MDVIEIGRRCRAQPAPPHIVREALLEPNRDPIRQWLVLEMDERFPEAHVVAPDAVTWTGLWLRRPDAVVRFDLAPRPARSGTGLTRMLLVEPPEPDAGLLGHLRQRVNQLINAELRYSFGQ